MMHHPYVNPRFKESSGLHIWVVIIGARQVGSCHQWPPPKKRWYRPTAPPAVTTDRLQQFLPGWSDLITLMIILIILVMMAIFANVKIINVFARKSPSSLEMLSPNCLPCGDHLSSSSAIKVPQGFPEHDNSENQRISLGWLRSHLS